MTVICTNPHGEALSASLQPMGQSHNIVLMIDHGSNNCLQIKYYYQ